MDNLDHLHQFARGTNRYHEYAMVAMEPVRRALGYQPKVEVIPDSANVSVAAKSTYEHRVSVPVGSLLWAISGSSEQAEGFRVQIIDTATDKAVLSRPALFGNVTGQGSPAHVKNCRGVAVSIRQPLAVLPKPRIIIEPAVLKVQVTNLSANANRLQLVLWLCTPPAPGEPTNEWNGILEAEAELSASAIRGQTVILNANGQASYAAPQNDNPLKRPALNVPFNASVVGDNLVVPGAQGYLIGIHQMSLFSTAQQTLRFLDRTVDLMGPLTDFNAGSGYFLPYQEEPHFVLSEGNPFIVNLAAGSTGVTGAVTGFIKYRMFERWPL